MIEDAARAFVAIGIHEKDVVPIVSVSTVTSIVCFYALNRIGAVSDYLNVLSEEKDLREYFEEVNAKVVVTLDLFEKKVVNAAMKCGVKNIITFGINEEMPLVVSLGYKIKTAKKIPATSELVNLLKWKDLLQKSNEINEIYRHKDPDEMCLIAHTGGTTGIPKAVMLSDRALNTTVYNYLPLMGNMSRGERFLNIMIPFVVYGSLVCMHLPLVLGWCLVIIPKFDARDWKNYIGKYKINCIGAVPSYVLPMLFDESLKNTDFSRIKVIGVGGDGLTMDFENDINRFLSSHNCSVPLQKGYGLTEVCSVAVTSSANIVRDGSVGVPIKNTNLMIYDSEKDEELSYGKIGEVCINSPSRMIGYLNNEEATKELFRKHKDGLEWLHTGDLGYIDEDGFLFLVGRMKRMILTTKDGVAYKVFPNIVEEMLDKHKYVTNSCIVGTKDRDDQVLCAFIVYNSNYVNDKNQVERELRIMCNEQLPSYARPFFYEFCERLPLTAAGKVDYRRLEEMAEHIST